MLTYKDIVKDGANVLREKCVDVTIPFSNEDLKHLEDMDDYLANSYDEKLCKKYDIRPGVGIAAPQIGINKKMLCIMAYDEKGNFHHYAFVNPKIISYSVELTYLESGEGCLSVEDIHKGYIHRHKRVKVKSLMYDFEKNEFVLRTISFSGYLAVVFQHEYDHLNGILFYDHINKENPFFVPENSKPIKFEEN